MQIFLKKFNRVKIQCSLSIKYQNPNLRQLPSSVYFEFSTDPIPENSSPVKLSIKNRLIVKYKKFSQIFSFLKLYFLPYRKTDRKNNKKIY